MRTINKEQILAKIGRVVVLMGGASVEREISLLSGQAVMAGLQRLGIDAVAIDVGNDVIEQLQKSKPDLVFNLLHGKNGEDGVMQGLLEMMEIPYTGSGVLASALAMDKLKSKLIWRQCGLPTADYKLLGDDSDWQQITNEFGKVVVKPVSGGSSLGIAIVSDAESLQKEYEKAKEFDQHIMAEKCIEGPEYSTGVLGDELLPTILLETDRQFFDYEAKYIDEATRITCPVDIPQEQMNRLKTLVRQAYNSLGCTGLARVDFMQDQTGEFYLLELNTVPGMTSHSFVPTAAERMGISFDELLLRILDCELAN
ncbi:MAG: D-alanine--D-alanine ligase [Pseudomonadales bacterium]|nr:D-alanine--D-alanine ligase [Pseudomonadales bacterium]